MRQKFGVDIWRTFLFGVWVKMCNISNLTHNFDWKLDSIIRKAKKMYTNFLNNKINVPYYTLKFYTCLKINWLKRQKLSNGFTILVPRVIFLGKVKSPFRSSKKSWLWLDFWNAFFHLNTFLFFCDPYLYQNEIIKNEKSHSF